MGERLGVRFGGLSCEYSEAMKVADPGSKGLVGGGLRCYKKLEPIEADSRCAKVDQLQAAKDNWGVN